MIVEKNKFSKYLIKLAASNLVVFCKGLDEEPDETTL